MTTTHTHLITYFTQDERKVCDHCNKKVEGFVSHVGQVEGCEHKGNNYPCGCDADVHDDKPKSMDFSAFID